MIEETLMTLITDMEAEGYRIGMNREGTGYWIKISDRDLPDICSKARFNMARTENPEIDDAVIPFLKQHRPFSMWFNN